LPELLKYHGGNLDEEISESRALLERAVSLPMIVEIEDDSRTLLRRALVDVLRASPTGAIGGA
jgi:hypothetical protein